MQRHALRQLSPPRCGRLVLLVVISSVPNSWDRRGSGEGVLVGSKNQSLLGVSVGAGLLFTFSRMVYPMLSAENISRIVRHLPGFVLLLQGFLGSISTEWVEDLSFLCDAA